MLRNTLLWLALAALVAGSPALAQDMSVDDIIAKNIETRGGYDALKAVDAARVEGTMNMGGMEAPFSIEYKRPQKVRMEFTMQGMTGVQAYDGESGWSVMPFMGKTDPEPMAEDQLKQIQDQADFIDGTLVDYADKGHTVELVGKEDVEGTEAYKLKVTKKNGDVVYSYLDTEYFLEFKQETKAEMMGQEVNMSVTFGDYKEVGDIVLAHSIEATAEGAPAGQVITLKTVDLGAEVSDDRFVMPEPAAKDDAEGTDEKDEAGGR